MAISAAIVSTLVLSSCGGGGSGSNDPNFTERPRTLDDLILTLDDTAIALEFRRSSTSPREASIANPETGSVGYTFVNDGNEEASIGLGTVMQIAYPQTLQSLSYSYQPINDVSGLLTLQSVGATIVIITNNNGLPISTAFPFTPGAPVRPDFITLFPTIGATQWNPTFLLTFINDGTVITDVSVLARPENVNNIGFITANTIPQNFSPLFIPSLQNLADGSYNTGGMITTLNRTAVPVNYTQDELTGTISEQTLDDRDFIFTPTTADATNPLAILSQPFQIIFSDAEDVFSSDFDEEGNATYSLPQTGVNLTGNLRYQYDFTDGTDVATLDLIGNVAGATTGSYTLNYTSSLLDTNGVVQIAGNYVISAPGTTYDGEIGTFTVTQP